MDRRQRMLEGLRKEHKLIEIGASHSPLVPKRAGWKTFVVDHATRDKLIDKYSYNVDQAEIVEDVDIVWADGPLHTRFDHADHGSFDAIVASHVLEHLPDPIDFLKSCDVLLKPHGRIVLALPDKRRCYDFFGNISTTGDLLENHINGQRIHTFRAAFNDVAYAVSNNGAIGWGPGQRVNFAFVHSLGRAINCADRTRRLPLQYYDHHAWRFVPSSFALIILELSVLGYISMRIGQISDVHAQEFFVDLVKDRSTPPTESELISQRMTLLKENVRAMTLQLQEMGQ